MSINPALGPYAMPLAEYGYDNLGVLQEANEQELDEAMAEIGVKKPHRKLVKKAFRLLVADPQ